MAALSSLIGSGPGLLRSHIDHDSLDPQNNRKWSFSLEERLSAVAHLRGGHIHQSKDDQRRCCRGRFTSELTNSRVDVDHPSPVVTGDPEMTFNVNRHPVRKPLPLLHVVHHTTVA